MDDVDAFLAGLTHARLDEVLLLRRAILDAVPELTERVKWNAPSFCVDGDDRVTFRLQPGDRVQLVLRRGARRRPADDGFAFHDPSGLLRMVSPDRGVVELADAAASAAAVPALQGLVRAWVAAAR